MARHARWLALLAVACVTAPPRAALACSCIGVDTRPPSFEAWPSGGSVPTDAHLWVNRRVDAELTLFADGRPLATVSRAAHGTWFDVASTTPLPARSRVELRARDAAGWRLLGRYTVLDAPGGPLPAGGELLRVDAVDGDIGRPCSNGSPETTLHFAPFSAPTPLPVVPYALWFSLDPAPLDVERSPDRIAMVEGGRLVVSGGGICDPRDYWLPVGKGGARLAAAAIDVDGKPRAPTIVAFRAALSSSAAETETRACVASVGSELQAARGAQSEAALEVASEKQLRRRVLWLALGLGMTGLTVAIAGLARRRRLPPLALALSLSAAATLALASLWPEGDAHARLAARERETERLRARRDACYATRGR